MGDRWAFGIHFGSDEISAKSIFSHLPVPEKAQTRLVLWGYSLS
jgi:hypothetical protein